MTLLRGLSTEELQIMEKNALAMPITEAREYLAEKSGFSEGILWAWIDDLAKKHPRSRLATSRNWSTRKRR